MNQNADMTLQKTSTPAVAGQLEPTSHPPTATRRWRRAAVASVVVCGMVFSGFSVLPSVLLNTGLRDQFLNARLEHTGLQLSSASAVGGWLTPVAIRDVRLADPSGQVLIQIDEISTSRTVTGLLSDRRDLGQLRLIKPKIQLTLDEDGNLPPDLFRDPPDAGGGTGPVFELQVKDAAFILAVPWRRLPIVELDGLTIDASVEPTPTGRQLTIEPVVLLDHAPLSESHTEQNLALVAPVLSQSTELSGTVSASLDRLVQPLDGDEPPVLQLSGRTTFHEVDARLKQDWVMELSRLVGRTIGKQVPDRLQIARDSEVRFRVNEAGIYHEGLAFLLPDIAPDMAIQSAGLVGLDETLDLALSINLPEVLPRNSFLSVVSKMTRLPFRIQVKGTVDEPRLVMPAGLSLVDQLARNLQPASADEPPPSIGESVGRIVGSTLSEPDRKKPESIVSGVLNIIRAARQSEDAPADEESAEEKSADASESKSEKRRQRKDRRRGKSL